MPQKGRNKVIFNSWHKLYIGRTKTMNFNTRFKEEKILLTMKVDRILRNMHQQRDIE